MSAKDTLDELFVPLGLVEMWPQITMRYKYFDFKDDISDGDRYDEYIWVVEQFRKFIGSKRSQVLSWAEDLDKLSKNVEQWLADGSEKISVGKGESIRPRLVYVAMRNDWLVQLLHVTRFLMEEDNGYRID
jgi:hypothetical protein